MAASLAISPGWPEKSFGAIPLVAGLAACDAIGGAVALKWPNDLVIDDQKVGGILAEADGDMVVIGLGVNLWWPEPMEGAAALFSSDPGREAPGWMAEHWADRLIARLADGPGRWGREEYAGLCSTIGRRISWEPDGEGTAAGIAPDGGLIVDTSDGEMVLRSGEISDVRPAGS
jgi:BirA family biotin operon repressor/biotin-[acetyl-CoA-carboxylase] ligase